MTEQSAIDAATRRLTLALEALDAAVDRRIEMERSRAILTEQVHALDADRSRLAADLDSQAARARRLETANRDIASRLDAAMQNVRSVLDGTEHEGQR
jgi:hypothetical protein